MTNRLISACEPWHQATLEKIQDAGGRKEKSIMLLPFPVSCLLSYDPNLLAFDVLSMLSLSLSSAVSHHLLLHTTDYVFITTLHSTNALSVFVLIHTNTRWPPFMTHCLQWFRVLDASCPSQVLLCTWFQLWIQAQQAPKEINRSWLSSRPQIEKWDHRLWSSIWIRSNLSR